MAMTTMKHVTPMFDASELLVHPDALRTRAQADGYVYLPGVLDQALVWELRAAIAEILLDMAWIQGDPMDLVTGFGSDDIKIEGRHPDWIAFYNRVQSLRAFHAFAHQPALQQIAHAICGGEHIFHPRHICRLCFPHTQQFTTPPHQDYFYINGSPETWTAWVPIGNCPISLGSLAVLPGSHREGLLPVHAADGAGGHACDCTEQQAWVAADMQAGDVLCIHSHVIHQGQDNQTDNACRLSVDLRFQHPADPIHPSSLEPHMQYISWEEIYATWPKEDALKYYWQQYQLNIVDE